MKIKLLAVLMGLVMITSLLTACLDFSGQSIAEGAPQDEISDIVKEEEDEESEIADEENEEEEQTADEASEEEAIDVFDSSSIAVLVNKQHSLGEDYQPEDLVTVEVPTVLENPEVKKLRKEAADKLKEMFESAKEEGIILHARSGYRSYNTQVQLFNNYASNHGEEAANKYSARAGQSEHQTGLAMDITSESVNYQLSKDFGQVPEGVWVKENAHRFGFIIRYPEGKEEITGYMYEPWHLRYLGVELASHVCESGLTYEEYLIDKGIIQ